MNEPTARAGAMNQLLGPVPLTPSSPIRKSLHRRAHRLAPPPPPPKALREADNVVIRPQGYHLRQEQQRICNKKRDNGTAGEHPKRMSRMLGLLSKVTMPQALHVYPGTAVDCWIHCRFAGDELHGGTTH